MYASIFHRHIQCLIDHPVTIEQVFPFEQIGDHPNREVVHRSGSIPNRNLCIWQQVADIVGEHVWGDHIPYDHTLTQRSLKTQLPLRRLLASSPFILSHAELE